MLLALNEAKVASQREIAIAYWGIEDVLKNWDKYWMRARVRYKLEAAREIERMRRGDG